MELHYEAYLHNAAASTLSWDNKPYERKKTQTLKYFTLWFLLLALTFT